jgi:Meiotically Up-regulated Gene 113 (MUG113) protein
MKNHFVYIIQAKTMRLLKFGRTSRMSVRLSELQIGSPDELTVLWISSAMDFGQACKAEKYLHDKFDPFHVRGEWYSPESEVISFVDGLISAAPSGIEGADIRLIESLAEFKQEEIDIPSLERPHKPFPRNNKSKKHFQSGKKERRDHVMGNIVDGVPVRLSDVRREKRKA